jgi:undecaprenyl-diphosphatase
MPVERATGPVTDPAPTGTAVRALAERPVAVLLLTALTAATAVAVAVDGAGGVLPGDEELSRGLAERSGAPEAVASVVTLLGDGWTSVAVLAAAAAVTWRHHRWVAGAALTLVVVRLPLVYGLKWLVGSERPAVDPVAELTTGAWPSGHALTAALAWGFLPAAVGASTGSPRARAAAVAWAWVVVPAVAVSRVVLGVHWVIDVVGGVAVGVLALVVVDVAGERAAGRDAGRPAPGADPSP